MKMATKAASPYLAAAALIWGGGSAWAQSFSDREARATTALNVRSGPSTGYAVVDTLARGEGVLVEKCNRGWCYVEHDGSRGWVSGEYLSDSDSAPADILQSSGPAITYSGTALATVALNVRSGPGIDYPISDALYEGQEVGIGECQGGWCQISAPSGEGWVSSRYVKQRGGLTPQQEGLPREGSYGDAVRATAALNVRSGPGTNFRTVDALFTSEKVTVLECGSGWCRVESEDGVGWVSSRYLTGDFAHDDALINFNESMIGYIRTPSASEAAGQVCFYEHSSYRGEGLCAQPGDAENALQTLNDRISSVAITGNAEVQVCEDADFGGACVLIHASNPRLPQLNNDNISSYRVL